MNILTVKDVAERLKVSPACIYQLIAECKIAHVRIGCGRGAIRITETDLMAFLEGSRVDQRPQLVPQTLKHIKLGV